MRLPMMRSISAGMGCPAPLPRMCRRIKPSNITSSPPRIITNPRLVDVIVSFSRLLILFQCERPEVVTVGRLQRRDRQPLALRLAFHLGGSVFGADGIDSICRSDLLWRQHVPHNPVRVVSVRQSAPQHYNPYIFFTR